MSLKRYFKIIPANKQDADRLYYILTSRTFYPESTSTPPLPGAYDAGFDYRQFFKVIGFDNTGSALVYTRHQYEAADFDTDIILVADWTTRYGLTIAPTIVEDETYSETSAIGRNTNTDLNVFLSWDYQLVNNR